jgi:hypothetical protein
MAEKFVFTFTRFVGGAHGDIEAGFGSEADSGTGEHGAELTHKRGTGREGVLIPSLMIIRSLRVARFCLLRGSRHGFFNSRFCRSGATH